MDSESTAKVAEGSLLTEVVLDRDARLRPQLKVTVARSGARLNMQNGVPPRIQGE
jgi:hypothetical protein